MPDEILQIVAERGIPFLTHFTRLENLASIMEHGLLPRSLVDAQVPNGLVNDELRLDGRLGFNCLSISFPNGPMFYRFRQENPEANWIILLLPPIVLCRDGVLFCHHNAADARISGTADGNLTTPEALQGMFQEIPGHASRAEQRLKPYDPTDVQAEVLVPGAIERTLVGPVVFPSAALRDANVHLIGQRKAYVNDRRGLYAKREYYRTWGPGAA